MIAPRLLMALGVICLGLSVSCVFLLLATSRKEKFQRRIASIRQSIEVVEPKAPVNNGGLLGAVAGLGMLLSRSGLLPASTLAQLENTLAQAGMRQFRALALFVGGKLLLLLLLPPLAWALVQHTAMSPMLRLLVVGGSAIAGLLLPDFILGRMRARYIKAVSAGLPDALDMLVICSEAGLGLETGFDRVASEIEPAHPAVAAELKITSAELRILTDRRTALTNMGTRTGLDTLKRLGATLIQTMRYGTPLSQALRTLSAEMRFEMLMRFEAQAARLPVLLTVPMILFILPCIFIVVGGPAGLTVMRTLLHR